MCGRTFAFDPGPEPAEHFLAVEREIFDVHHFTPIVLECDVTLLYFYHQLGAAEEQE
jgi:hypothetical protein